MLVSILLKLGRECNALELTNSLTQTFAWQAYKSRKYLQIIELLGETCLHLFVGPRRRPPISSTMLFLHSVDAVEASEKNYLHTLRKSNNQQSEKKWNAVQTRDCTQKRCAVFRYSAVPTPVHAQAASNDN